jgi:hypothetical protein
MKVVERDLISCGEAAEVLGVSLQAVHQGLRNGIVAHQLVNGRRMIDPHRLLQRWKGISDLEAQAEACNRYLDCGAWGPPPWTAEQWQTLRVVLEMAMDPATRPQIKPTPSPE